MVGTPPVSISTIDSKYIAYFAHFGLSVIKTDVWHLTLRHHAYNALQPSGHFHNDIGSVTLAVNRIPVIVDLVVLSILHQRYGVIILGQQLCIIRALYLVLNQYHYMMNYLYYICQSDLLLKLLL